MPPVEAQRELTGNGEGGRARRRAPKSERVDSVAIATVVTGDWWVWYWGVGYLLAGWPVLACGVTGTDVETTVRFGCPTVEALS